jgi:hypothetical protein
MCSISSKLWSVFLLRTHSSPYLQPVKYALPPVRIDIKYNCSSVLNTLVIIIIIIIYDIILSYNLKIDTNHNSNIKIFFSIWAAIFESQILTI